MPPRRAWNPPRHIRQERRERRQQQQQQHQQHQHQPQQQQHQSNHQPQRESNQLEQIRQSENAQQPIAPADLAIIQAATIFLDALYRSRQDQLSHTEGNQEIRYYQQERSEGRQEHPTRAHPRTEPGDNPTEA